MDIVTLDKSTYTPTEVVEDLDSILWVERYLEPGEFKIVCDPTPLLRQKLALGTFISHLDTTEVMIIENHDISETFGTSPKLEVTGRSLDSFLEKRIVALKQQSAFRKSAGKDPEANDYQMVSDLLWVQVYYLLVGFLTAGTFSPDQNLPNISVIIDTNVLGITADAKAKSIKKGEVLSTVVIDMLQSKNLGIRFERPMRDKNGNFMHHYDPTTDPNGLKMSLYIHGGTDRSQNVIFYYDSGDLRDARYFWSVQEEINAVHGSTYYAYKTNYASTQIPTGWDQKMAYLDLTEINQNPADAGTPQQILAQTLFQLEAIDQRSESILESKKKSTLLEATIAPNSSYKYRTHYLVGDTVYVVGNYGIASKMRVTEHAEVKDETGESSYPTLKVV